MENLTVETFKEKVFDYTQEKEWSFKGEKPVIIDFYADWCQPCKTIAPFLEEIDNEFDELEVYKINTEEQPELAASFGIQSIPSLLFVPVGADPQMALGALPKEIMYKAIKEVLGISSAKTVEEPAESPVETAPDEPPTSSPDETVGEPTE